MSDDRNPRKLNVLFIGHSYVRRLMFHRLNNNLSTNMTFHNLVLVFNYIYVGGKNYSFFNSDNKIRNAIKSHNPDIILISLAGNAVSKSNYYDIPSANAEMRIFHSWLCATFPSAKILPIEAEPRYNYHRELPVKHDPLHESYKSRRKAMNIAMSRMSCKHGLIRIFNRLTDRNLFLRHDRTPYVHLNESGNEIYWDIIYKGLDFSLRKWGFLVA